MTSQLLLLPNGSERNGWCMLTLYKYLHAQTELNVKFQNVKNVIKLKQMQAQPKFTPKSQKSLVV